MKNLLNKYNKLPKEVKASIWVIICTIVQKGIAFITVPIFTRLLSIEEYGLYVIFWTWQDIFQIFITLNLTDQVFNNGMIKYKNDKDGYTIAMVGLTLTSSLIWYVIYVLFNNIGFNYTNLSFTYMILMYIYIISAEIIGLWIVRQRFDYKYKGLTIITILIAILNPLLGIFLIRLMGGMAIYRIISMVVIELLIAIFILARLFKKNKKIINIKYWRYALKLDLPLIPHYLSIAVLSVSDKIMIGKITNNASVAFYNVAQTIAALVQFITAAVNTSFIPWIYRQCEEKKYEKIRHYSSIIIIVVAIMSFLLMLCGPEIISIFGKSEYMDAVTIIPILIFCTYIMFIYTLFIDIEMFNEKTKMITIGSIGASVINILLNFIFISKFGYKAAAYSTLFGHIGLAIFHYFIMRNICIKKNITKDIFNIKLILKISSLLLSIALFISYIYKYIILRYFIILIIFFISIIFRKKIITIKTE